MHEDMIVWSDSNEYRNEAEEFAEKYGMPFTEDREEALKSFLRLHYTKNGVFLENGDSSISGDYTKLLKRLRYDNLTHELIVKAAKIKDRGNLDIVDMTAGMGEDSLLLAASGHRVTLLEKDPVIAELLRDTVKRAGSFSGLSEAVARMTVVCADSKEYLEKKDVHPDIVYLDPMFPEKEKNSLTKKKFQLIHLLEKPCSDEEEMLKAAVDSKPLRIIIKRPLKGPWLGDKKPSFSLTGKTIRYDCLVL